MNLLGIVAVSGKPGLWRALAQNKTGYILESLDAQKTRMVANLSTAKMAALNEITLFGLDEDIKLSDVFEKMKTAKAIPDSKTDGNKLRMFFREVAPYHDEEKVYASDMKKVIAWFHILKDMPLFNEAEPGGVVDEGAPVAEDVPVVEEVIKPVAEKKDGVVKKAAKAAGSEKTIVGIKEVETAPVIPKVKKPAAKKAL